MAGESGSSPEIRVVNAIPEELIEEYKLWSRGVYQPPNFRTSAFELNKMDLQLPLHFLGHQSLGEDYITRASAILLVAKNRTSKKQERLLSLVVNMSIRKLTVVDCDLREAQIVIT